MAIKQTPIKDILESLKLPLDSKVLGYVINLPDGDEYLYTESVQDDSEFRMYSQSPMMAKIFDDYHDALKSSGNVPKYSIVCLLIETEESFAVAPIVD